jgi:hypothetical protein
MVTMKRMIEAPPRQSQADHDKPHQANVLPVLEHHGKPALKRFAPVFSSTIRQKKL